MDGKRNEEKMKKTLLVLVFLLMFPLGAVADESDDLEKNPYLAHHMQKGSPACLTRDLLRQFLNATLTKDNQAGDYLLTHGCILFKPDIHITVLDTGPEEGPLTIVKIRGYTPSGDTVELWTFRVSLAK